jgi:capsular exopolysaccharide synthesis family protein
MSDTSVLQAAPEGAPNLQLSDYLRLLYRRKLAIILGIIIFGAAAAGYSFTQRKVYSASTTILLQPQIGAALLDVNPNSETDPVRQLQTQMQVIEGPPVAALVQKALGYTDGVTAQAVGQADSIRLSVKDGNPSRAAAQANAYAKAYIQYLGNQLTSEIASTVGALQQEIAQLQSQIDPLNAKLLTLVPNSPDYSSVTQERNDLASQQATFQSRISQLQLDALVASGGVSVVSAARPPQSPIEPRPKRNIAIGLGIGLVIGLAGAFLWESLDDAVSSRTDLERITFPVPTISAIPVVAGWKNAKAAHLVAVEIPDGSSTEAYRSLRTALRFIQIETGQKLFQFTSPGAGEGKTTTAANLGAVIASTGNRVLLVDCDLRRARLHQFFDLPNDIGLTSVLLGQKSFDEALVSITQVPSLDLLRAGPPVPNPAEWLSSNAMANLVDGFQYSYDVVLFDNAPALPVTDATVLSALVDGTIVVVASGSTSRRAVRRTLDGFHQIGAPVVGLVLNRVAEQPLYGYSYEQYYQYLAGAGTPKRRRFGRRQRDSNGSKTDSMREPPVLVESPSSGDVAPSAPLSPGHNPTPTPPPIERALHGVNPTSRNGTKVGEDATVEPGVVRPTIRFRSPLRAERDEPPAEPG